MPTVKAFTGPSHVGQYAERLRIAGFEVITEGTEHVYVLAEGTDPHAAAWNANAQAEQWGIRLTFKPV